MFARADRSQVQLRMGRRDGQIEDDVDVGIRDELLAAGVGFLLTRNVFSALVRKLAQRQIQQP